MFNRKILTAAVIAALAATSFSTSTLAAQAQRDATAVIVTALSVTHDGVNDLSFGDISPPGTGGGAGTVTVDTTGFRSALGAGLAGGTFGFGGFNVSGCNNCGYTVSLSAPANLTSAGNNIPVVSMSYETASGGIGLPGTLSGTGNDTISVGGVIQISETQATGTYTGQYTITVDYP